jgi:hypothetical protein
LAIGFSMSSETLFGLSSAASVGSACRWPTVEISAAVTSGRRSSAR